MLSYNAYFKRVEVEYRKYCQENFEHNENIYDNLTSVQLETVKKYMRARTRENFKQICTSNRLVVKPDKAVKLFELMKGLDDWVYDGTVDTGHLGGGCCSLGHSLRYEHWAVSESTGLELVFGSTCAGDFFGIDQSMLRKLDEVRNNALEEIKFSVFIIDTGRVEEYKALYFDVCDKCRDAEANQMFIKILGEYAGITMSMMKNNIPLPKTLVMKTESFKYWYETSFMSAKFDAEIENRLEEITKGSGEHYRALLRGESKVKCKLNHMISGHIRLETDKDVLINCVLTSKKIEDAHEQINKFKEVCEPKIFSISVKNFVVTKGKLKRRATKNELTENARGVTEELSPLFVEETTKVLASLSYCMEYNGKVENIINEKNRDQYLDIVCENYERIDRAIKFVSNRIYEIENKINNLTNETEYGVADENFPEIKEAVPFERVFSTVKDNLKSSTPEIIKDILRKRHTPESVSLKQGQILRDYYDKLVRVGIVQDEMAGVVKEEVGDLASVVVSITMDKKYITVIDIDKQGNIITGKVLEVGKDKVREDKYKDVTECVIFIGYGCISILKDVGIHHKNMKIKEIGKELSIEINGNGGAFAKFRDVSMYVGANNNTYNEIIQSKFQLMGHNNEERMCTTGIMMALANKKLYYMKG